MDFQQQQHLSPTASPERQANNIDPFAAFGVGPTMPNVAAPVGTAPPQQPPQTQQQPMMTAAPTQAAQVPAAPGMMNLQPQMAGYVAPPVQQMPTYTAPAPVQQPTYANITPPVPQQPTMQMPTGFPPAMPQAYAAQQPMQAAPAAVPPMPEVCTDPQNYAPDSPLGNVSAILTPGPTVQAPAPSMPTMQPMQEQPAPVADPPQANANPFDFAPVASSMPTAQPPNAPPSPTAQQIQPDAANGTLSPRMSPVNALAPQVTNDPFGYCFSPMVSPVANNNAIVPSAAAPSADPFGVFGGGQPQQQPPAMPDMPTQAPPAAPSTQAMVPSQAPNADPFGVFGTAQPPAPAANADQFGAALVPAGAPPAVDDDPFGVFGAPTPAAAAPAQPEPSAMDAPLNPIDTTPNRSIAESVEDPPLDLDSNGLPNDGEYYEARVCASSLGVMFYTAREVKDSLLQKIPSNMIEALGSRPIVSYVASGSAAYNSGIHLGHTVLEVNGVKVEDVRHCADLIRSTPRPLNIRCFNTNFEVVESEHRHLVKYDSLDMEAPKSAQDWKMKYVTVGGIVANPWTVNMYYSKVRHSFLDRVVCDKRFISYMQYEL